MKCAPAGSYKDGGGEVTVLIRPEQTTLAPFASSAGEVTGKVTEARYHGHDALIAVDVADEVCITATGQVKAWPEGSF
jgi:iron(III) transport system ATP-binding protein